jgi:hypothetical protein
MEAAGVYEIRIRLGPAVAPDIHAPVQLTISGLLSGTVYTSIQ